MTARPTYEELEKKIRQLEAEVAALKKTEKLLRQDREELAEIFSMSLDMICIADLNTATFLKVNPAFTRILGYSHLELLDRPFLELIHPDDLDATINVIDDRLKAGQKVVNFTNRFRCKEGNYRWLEWVSQPMPERGITFAVAHDISARKRVEASLRESQIFIKTVMDNLPIGIAVNSVDPSVKFEYMNENFSRFYRAKRAALADPDGFWEAVYEDPQFRQQIKQRVLNDCASGDPARMFWTDVPITRQGAGTTFISARNIPIPDKRLMISTVWDVTERRLAEMEKEKWQAQFQQAQKLESVGRLAGGVAHDLNNLLSPILGYGEMLSDDFGPDDTRKEFAEQIVQAGIRARDIVRQLLAFSRKQTMEIRSFDLNGVITRFEPLLRKTIREDIALVIIPEPSLPIIRGDIGQLEQVIMNLAVNAQDAMPNGGRLTIEVAMTRTDDAQIALPPDVKPGAYVMLAVSDTGEGIDSETRKHIFEPFFTTKNMDKGTGLGLATVYGIVMQHGGQIRVESKPGQGAVFRIFLPVSDRTDAPEQTTGPPPEKLQGKETILLVEDDKHVRSLALAILQRQGYSICSAANGKEALERSRNLDQSPHLLLTDVVMPEMNGKDLFDRLSARIPGLKVLYMSGYTDNVIAHRGVMDAGVNFIQKPFSVQVLATKVREVLDQ